MAKIIQLKPKKVKIKKLSKETQERKSLLKLLEISNKIDEIILYALEEEEVDVHELAGLLAHRLGTLMRNMSDKNKLLDVCEEVLKKQALGD